MTKQKGYSLQDDLMPIIKGKVPLPNFKEMELEKGIGVIASAGGLQTVSGINNAKVPGMTSNWGTWARYWLDTTQGGGYSGAGYVIFWDNSKGRVGTFTICDHKFIEGSGADNTRGWHPGHCGKCGLDMTVDSSD